MEGDDFLQSMKAEANESQEKIHSLNTALQSSTYQGQEDANLIVFQIDTGDMLGKIEHFLRGERIKIDNEGNEDWVKPTILVPGKVKKIIYEDAIDEDGNPIQIEKEVEVEGEVEKLDNNMILFNEYGVNSIMSIIGNYIDKNTILSFYDEMRINEILADLGDELADFIYCNYEKMGMDTDFKKTRYQLTVISILHSIESTYRRSLRGKTMEDVNSSKIFTQMDNMGRSQQMPMKKKFNLFKPRTW